MRLRSQRSVATLVTSVVLVCVLALSGCGSRGDSEAEAAAKAFATAFAGQDAAAISALTSSPSQAADALSETFAGMHPRTLNTEVSDVVDYGDGSATFTMRTTWQWPDDRKYEDRVNGRLRKLSTGWKVTWDPGLIHSGLPVGGRLEMARLDVSPAPSVRAGNGKPLMRVIPINELVINPAGTKNLKRSVRRLAAVIEPVAPLVTTKVIDQKLAEANGGEAVAVSLRNEDMKRLTDDPDAIAGVSVRKTGNLVMTDRRVQTPLQAGLTNYWQAIRDATAGWQVQMVAPGVPEEKLAGEDGTPAPDVMTTFDVPEQLDLSDAAAVVAQPATIMTFDAKSGAILAMGQNDAASEKAVGADVAYPTGSTLDPVFTALDKATSGNETKANEQLNKLGLGIEITVPGVSAPTVPSVRVQAAAFRPQNFTASMLNMGALGITIARSLSDDDSTAPPFLIKGADTKVSGGSLGAIDPAAAKQIGDAMRATARTGDASDLKGAGGLRALVGTNGPQGPGWFVGITAGGRVIVVYCEGERSGTAALQVAQKYFGS